jgi:hypothetical protein
MHQVQEAKMQRGGHCLVLLAANAATCGWQQHSEIDHWVVGIPISSWSWSECGGMHGRR